MTALHDRLLVGLSARCRVRHSKIEIARVYHASRRWPDRL